MLIDTPLVTTSWIRSRHSVTFSFLNNPFPQLIISLTTDFLYIYQDREDEAVLGRFVHSMATFGDMQRSVDCLQ